MTAAHRPTIAVDLRALVSQPTGIGWFTLEMLHELGRLGGANYLGMAHAEVHEEQRLADAGVTVETHPSRLGVVWQQWRLPKRLEAPDIDGLWSPLLTLPARLPKPGVVTIHDLTPLLFPKSHRLKVRLSILPFLRRTLNTASRIVVDSKSTADDLRVHYPSCVDRVTVVYPGVTDTFRPGTPEDIAKTRDALGCPEGYVLYVGTLEPRKNVGLVLDVWETLRRDDDSIPPLVLAGGPGWHSRGLLARIRSLEAAGVHYLGHVDRERLIKTFQAASAFIYPSAYEGFGLPPLEAMACGVPTVTSNRSSLPEVAGDAALTIDPGDPEELAGALRRILLDRELAKELSARGRKQARGFTWAAAAAKMQSILRDSTST